MSEFEQQPDEYWRKVFEEAAETPPPRVWDAIERRLDESEGPRILPLWSTGLGASQPLRWGAGLAAAVALLLVGWWTIHPATTQDSGTPVAQTSRPRPEVIRPNVTAPEVASAEAPAALSNRVSRPADTRPTLNMNPVTVALNVNRPARQRRAKALTAQGQRHSVESLAQADVREKAVPTPSATRATESTPLPALVVTDQPVSQPAPVLSPETPPANRVAFAPGRQTAVASPTASPNNAPVAQSDVQPAAFPEPIQSVLANNVSSAEPDKTQPNPSTRDVWASVSVMPGAFDPVVAMRVTSTSTPFVANSAAVNYLPSNVPTISSRADFSVAYQVSAGVQLTERWSVESGVGYLSGRSTVDTPPQTSYYTNYSNQVVNPSGLVTSDPSRSVANSVVNTLYVDALRSQMSSGQAAEPTVTKDVFTNNTYLALNRYSTQARQTLTNDYQYVQVPVQVGYQLRPRKRLGLVLLGGFLTNIFVRNTVADELVITSRDGVYRPLSWAASLGARFRYRPSRRWSASLAGLYQPSLGLGTRPGSVVQSQPTSVGMSFGVDYHF